MWPGILALGRPAPRAAARGPAAAGARAAVRAARAAFAPLRARVKRPTLACAPPQPCPASPADTYLHLFPPSNCRLIIDIGSVIPFFRRGECGGGGPTPLARPRPETRRHGALFFAGAPRCAARMRVKAAVPSPLCPCCCYSWRSWLPLFDPPRALVPSSPLRLRSPLPNGLRLDGQRWTSPLPRVLPLLGWRACQSE